MKSFSMRNFLLFAFFGAVIGAVSILGLPTNGETLLGAGAVLNKIGCLFVSLQGLSLAYCAGKYANEPKPLRLVFQLFTIVLVLLSGAIVSLVTYVVFNFWTSSFFMVPIIAMYLIAAIPFAVARGVSVWLSGISVDPIDPPPRSAMHFIRFIGMAISVGGIFSLSR